MSGSRSTTLDKSRPVTQSWSFCSRAISSTVDFKTGVFSEPSSLSQSCSDFIACSSTAHAPDVQGAAVGRFQRQRQVRRDAGHLEAVADEQAAGPHLRTGLDPELLH